MRRLLFILPVLTLVLNVSAAFGKCTGHFINPITDICWKCLFPISIGSAHVVSGENPDTKNPSLPIEVCKMKTGYRVGLNIGYWEPFALVDVTDTPYCFVNLGGFKLDISSMGKGSRVSNTRVGGGAFYHVHYYKYPLLYWLQLITSIACQQADQFDVGYLSELDPTWNDEELAFILNPEAVLFANPIAQTACAIDAQAAMTGLPKNKLFWCAGAQGSMYPLTGFAGEEKSPMQVAVLLSERLAFKLHRLGLIRESSPDAGDGVDGAICQTYRSSILPKARYRYQLVNPVSLAKHCYPFGRSTLLWESNHLSPVDTGSQGFLLWRKKNCTFL